LKKALITGGAGGIGLHLARRLVAQGVQVTLLDNFQRGARDADFNTVASHPQVSLLDADLGDRDLVQTVSHDFSHVFHLAAIVGVKNVSERPRTVLEDNVALTVAALEVASKQAQLERFVFASTSEVYAGTLQTYGLAVPTPESTPITLPQLYEPRSSYMLSKLYGEALTLHSGLPVTIVRPHNVYGPRMGQAHVIPQMMERATRLRDNEPFQVYSATHTRTFCFVDDAIEILLRLAKCPKADRAVVNLGTQTPEISMMQLAHTVLKVVGRNGELVPGPVTAGSPPRRAPDMSLCASLIDFRSQVPLEQGLRRTFDWYQDNIFSSG
jgi:nucleoside-diphosphate-sugar epimerase